MTNIVLGSVWMIKLKFHILSTMENCVCAHVHENETNNNVQTIIYMVNSYQKIQAINILLLLFIIMFIIIIIHRFNTYTHALHIYTQIVTIKIIWKTN